MVLRDILGKDDMLSSSYLLYCPYHDPLWLLMIRVDKPGLSPLLLMHIFLQLLPFTFPLSFLPPLSLSSVSPFTSASFTCNTDVNHVPTD